MNHNDWDSVFPEMPQGFHQAVQQTLNEQVLSRTGRRKAMKKRFPIMLAAVIAILGVTAAATYVIHWNGKLAEIFGASEQQQSQLASAGAVGSADQTVTENGLTVTALQTLGDKNGVYLLLDVKAPEGIPLSDSSVFEGMSVDIEGVGDHAEICRNAGRKDRHNYRGQEASQRTQKHPASRGQNVAHLAAFGFHQLCNIRHIIRQLQVEEDLGDNEDGAAKNQQPVFSPHILQNFQHA